MAADTSTIRDIAARFNSPALTGEQAERIQAMRHAAAGFAAVVWQATAGKQERERALAAIDEAFAFARLAVEREPPTANRDGLADRLALLAKAEDFLSRGDLASLRAFVGVVDPEPLGEAKKKKTAS